MAKDSVKFVCRPLLGLFAAYVLVAATCGIILQLSKVFLRQELQTINARFEARPWLKWTKASIDRLHPVKLWQYHEAHEIPRAWWAWDYTLSWLLENNHPPVKHKVIIFNHLLEDEPPLEAVEHHPWMRPLLRHPLPRESLAEIVEFLSNSGVRLIILDNDFPQYQEGDKQLAKAIVDSWKGKGKWGRVPVFVARTVNRYSFANRLMLEVPSTPGGLMQELGALQPNEDVVEKYSGITGILPDEDQVVRRLAVRLPGAGGSADHQSIVVKALSGLSERLPYHLPDIMDIDFAGPPNSELYPVRPMSYLLDPERREALTRDDPNAKDVSLKGALVILGDGVVDVFSTPYTNKGINQMSGAEIVINGLETISRLSWPIRVTGWLAAIYLVVVAVAGALVWLGWKALQQRCLSPIKGQLTLRLLRLMSDLICFVLIIAAFCIASCLLFAYCRLLLPVFVPSVALGLGTIAATLLERENEREKRFLSQLQASREKLQLAHERYESDLKRQEAEARAREVLRDRQQRREFVRRINHDLNAPVSVLNWTLAELKLDDISSINTREKVERLVKNSDKLCELIDQLVQTYDYDATMEETGSAEAATCDLARVLADCLDLQKPLAQMCASELEWSLPEGPLKVKANALEMSRIVDNLVRNAIKHNARGTRVYVDAAANGNTLTIRVSDNGQGIAAQHIDHIFDPGYRIDPNGQNGQGLGLDIVKTLVEKSGGQIFVESAVGQGTTFSITLPLLSSDCLPESDSPPEQYGQIDKGIGNKDHSSVEP